MLIPCNDILFDQKNNVSREPFDLESCKDLATTIERDGLIHGVTVVPIKHESKKYKLIVGFRRFCAVAFVLKRDKIDCRVIDDLDEHQAHLKNVKENMFRKDMTYYEECRALKEMYPKGTQTTVIAEEFGVTRSWVRPRWFIWDLAPDVISMVKEGLLNCSDITLILMQKTNEDQVATAEMIRNAHETGVPIRSIQSKISKRKAYRTPKEIQRMMTILMHNERSNEMHTLRYAAGEISDEQYLKYIGCNEGADGIGIPGGDDGENLQNSGLDTGG